MKSITLLFLFFTQAQAADDFEKLYNLSEDVRSIVLEAPGGNPLSNKEFNLSVAQSDQMKALASLDDSMRVYLENSKNPDCVETFSLTKADLTNLQKKVDDRTFVLEAVVFTSDKKYDQNALGRFTTDDYMNYMGQLYQSGNSKAYSIYSVDSLIEKYKSSNPGNNLDSLSFKEKENVLNNFASTYLGSKLPDGLLMKEMAFQGMVNNSANWKSILNDAKDKLSSEQKIQLVSKLGGQFGNLYNYERRDAGEKANGIFINTEELLDSVKKGIPGGICRDIALAQTQFLKELGFKQNYVVAYKTATGRHSTVISTDPVTRKIVKFNYSETTTVKEGSGTEALKQDTSMPDMGLGFRIYDTNGKPVTKVASELAQMLKSSSGGDVDRDFNQRNYSLAKVGFGSEYVNGNLFTGQTSSGERLYGVALYKDFSSNKYTKLGIGASISKLEGNRSLVNIDQTNLYLRANSEINSPSLKLGNTETSAFVGTNLYLMSSSGTSKFIDGRVVTQKNEIDVDGDMYIGAKNTYKSANEKTAIDSKIYANFYPDWEHVAKGGKTVAVLDSVVVKSGVSYSISENTKALIDTAVIVRNYGTNIVAKAIIQDEKNGIQYTAGGAAPLTKDMPTFLPGGERRAFAGIEKVSNRYMFSIEVERNFDSKSNTVMLKGQVKF